MFSVTAGLILLTGTNLCLCLFSLWLRLFSFSFFLLKPHFHTGHKRWSIGKWSIILVRVLFASLSVEKSNKSEPSLWHSLTLDRLPQRLLTGVLFQSQTPASQWQQQQVGYYTLRRISRCLSALKSTCMKKQCIKYKSGAGSSRVGGAPNIFCLFQRGIHIKRQYIYWGYKYCVY